MTSRKKSPHRGYYARAGLPVCRVNPDDLKAASCQPIRRTSPRALDGLKWSIKAFGILQPVIAIKSGTLVDGHGRWAVAKELGIQVPVAYIEGNETDIPKLWQMCHPDVRKRRVKSAHGLMP